MRIKMIPRCFLIHTARFVDVETGEGLFGGRKETDGALIERIRFISSKHELAVTRDDENYTVSAILIHQPGISTDCSFAVGQYIRWNGQLYEIVRVEPQYEAERLHHTEVLLICR